MMRYHHHRKIILPVSPRLNLLHTCSPLRGVRRLIRLLGLLLIAMFRRVSPVSMIVSEPGIMSEFSSDTEADLEDELRQLQPLPATVAPVSTVPSLRWVESPSSYPAPAVPVISSMATSTVTSVRSSGTMDAFPSYMPAYPGRTCPRLDGLRMCRDTSQYLRR